MKVLASQAFEELDSTQPGEGGSEERASGVQWGSGPAPSGSGEALKSSFNEEPTSASSSPLSGLQCTLLAVLVLLNSAMCIITALLMAVHFWRRFSSMCWKASPSRRPSRLGTWPIRCFDCGAGSGRAWPGCSTRRHTSQVQRR